MTDLSLIEKLQEAYDDPAGDIMWRAGLARAMGIIRQHNSSMVASKPDNPYCNPNYQREIPSEILIDLASAIDEIESGFVVELDDRFIRVERVKEILIRHIKTSEMLLDYDALTIAVEKQIKESDKSSDLELAVNIIQFLLPYLKPVSVSLEKCAIACSLADSEKQPLPGKYQSMAEYYRVLVKAVLNAAGVKYVD